MEYRITQNVVSHVYRTERCEKGIFEPTGNEFLRYLDAEDAIMAAIAFSSARDAKWVPVDKNTAGIHPELV